MSITIKTAIDKGIYQSEGGGTTQVRAEAATGPRNLLRLAALWAELSASAERSYGNIGHRDTWLEIDGVRIDAYDRADLDKADPAEFGMSRESRTQKARRLIAQVQSGGYARLKAEMAAREAADLRRMMDEDVGSEQA